MILYLLFSLLWGHELCVPDVSNDLPEAKQYSSDQGQFEPIQLSYCKSSKGMRLLVVSSDTYGEEIMIKSSTGNVYKLLPQSEKIKLWVPIDNRFLWLSGSEETLSKSLARYECVESSSGTAYKVETEKMPYENDYLSHFFCDEPGQTLADEFHLFSDSVKYEANNISEEIIEESRPSFWKSRSPFELGVQLLPSQMEINQQSLGLGDAIGDETYLAFRGSLKSPKFFAGKLRILAGAELGSFTLASKSPGLSITNDLEYTLYNLGFELKIMEDFRGAPLDIYLLLNANMSSESYFNSVSPVELRLQKSDQLGASIGLLASYEFSEKWVFSANTNYRHWFAANSDDLATWEFDRAMNYNYGFTVNYKLYSKLTLIAGFEQEFLELNETVDKGVGTSGLSREITRTKGLFGLAVEF